MSKITWHLIEIGYGQWYGEGDRCCLCWHLAKAFPSWDEAESFREAFVEQWHPKAKVLTLDECKRRIKVWNGA